MTEEQTLLTAIWSNPADDLPRLVYADWLDEHGRYERARVIRVRIEKGTREVCPVNLGAWCRVVVNGESSNVMIEGYRVGVQLVMSRGFVCEWRGPVWAWMGGWCRGCGGVGDDGGRSEQYTIYPTCGGSGKVEAVGPDVATRHPLEVVRFTDKEPVSVGGGEWKWDHPEEDEPWTDPHCFNTLPSRLYDRLRGVEPKMSCPKVHKAGMAIYGSKKDAETALSNVAVLWARGNKI